MSVQNVARAHDFVLLRIVKPYAGEERILPSNNPLSGNVVRK